ncbi:hypothetical protein BH09MYX1_BH09MYX1_47470 [soil metagenome]
MATDDEVEKKEAEDSSEEESEEEAASSDDAEGEASPAAKDDVRAEDEADDEEENEEAPEPVAKKTEAPAKKPEKKSAKPAAAAKKADDADPDEEAPAEALVAKEKLDDGVSAPTQFGYKRFVYAAYLAATIAIAFVLNKALDYSWFRLSAWKPEWFMSIGIEPRDEIIVPLSVAIAVFIGVRYWRDLKVRTMAEEVAEELTKVTWPTREEVTNSTTVVIITTIFATIFFALMDQFWLWVTKHVYGS